MLSNLHVLHSKNEFNIQYTRYLINSVLQNGLGSIALPTIYHPILDKLLANSDIPMIYWWCSMDETSDPYHLLDLVHKYKHISCALKPQTDFRLERLKKCVEQLLPHESIHLYINCINVEPKTLGIYLDNICINKNIVPIVLINEEISDSILYCKSTQKYCSVKPGLAHDWTFDAIEMATKCDINPLVSMDNNIVDLLHK